jgi:hypothetical protein
MQAFSQLLFLCPVHLSAPPTYRAFGDPPGPNANVDYDTYARGSSPARPARSTLTAGPIVELRLTRLM